MIIDPVSGKTRVLRQSWPVIVLLGAFLSAILVALGSAGLLPQSAFPAAFWTDSRSPSVATPGELALTPVDVLPVSDPGALRPLSIEDALAANAAIPIADPAPTAAPPLSVPLTAGQAWTRSVDCMTKAVYYEAANEPDAGQRAVAQVVLNRVRDPAYPNSVCGVVFEGSTRTTGCQFSFTCDGSLLRVPGRTGWVRARKVAVQALSGYVFAPVGMSTHYHANYVTPYWAPRLVKTFVEGAHIFYRWPGQRGLLPAFTARYAGLEPDISAALPKDPALADLASGVESGSPAPSTLRNVLRFDSAYLSARQGTGLADSGPGGGQPDEVVRPPAGVAPVRKQRWVLAMETPAGSPASSQHSGETVRIEAALSASAQ